MFTPYLSDLQYILLEGGISPEVVLAGTIGRPNSQQILLQNTLWKKVLIRHLRYFCKILNQIGKRESVDKRYLLVRSSNSIVGYAVVYILRLIGHTHDRESPIQNFSTAPKKLGAHISSPVWPPKPTEFVSYLGNLRCGAFTALKSVQGARPGLPTHLVQKFNPGTVVLQWEYVDRCSLQQV